MITREALAQFASTATSQEKLGSASAHFDMEGYLSQQGFRVIRRKPWQSHPGGFVFELDQCPFNPEHTGGSAAFTFVDGVPGFTCKHNGCHGKTIKDVFATYPAEQPVRLEAESASSDEERQTQAQILCELSAGADLFHTPDGDGYAQISVADHSETWAIRSTGFRRWLRWQFYQLKGRPPASQALQDAIGLLEARAQFESAEIPIFVRVAESGGAIYIDLCNRKWEAVEITAQGCRVVADPPIRFRRSKGMKPLPHPARGGSLTLLRDLINIGGDNNWLLCMAWLIAACRPTGPYPILCLHGEQGSAKSTTEKLLRMIIDPSTAPVRTLPRDERDLLIAGSNSWILAYDNVSALPSWLSDALCRVATGGGFSTRELYTDSDEVFLEATRPIILNGIDYIADRPDLADRAVILNLPTIDERHRREESDLYAEFERRLPKILGGLCDAVSGAIARLPQIVLTRKPRMADFARFASAAMLALGFPLEEFVEVYGGNRAEAVQETLEGDAVAAAIFALMNVLAQRNGTDIWEGNCKALLSELEQFANEAMRRSQDWPKTARKLSGRLRRLATFLRESGIEVTFHPKGTNGKRPVTITRAGLHPTATTATSATTDSTGSPNQSDASGQPGGGVAAEVAEQSPLEVEPPLGLASANPLYGGDNGVGEVVVADVAVDRTPVLESVVSGTSANRINLCAQCGTVEWEWVNGMWVCPHCGEPAPGQKRPERERIEL